jgi:hypothetical protein
MLSHYRSWDEIAVFDTSHNFFWKDRKNSFVVLSSAPVITWARCNFVATSDRVFGETQSPQLWLLCET